MARKERLEYIDLLRALSIVGVMVIHTLSFYLSNPLNLFFWNSFQFVVASFVFCSGIVHAHYRQSLQSIFAIVDWYKKRLSRILFPFYLYFFIHFFLFLLFPFIFNHFGMQKSVGFFIGSLLLYGGINSDWLPLLFVELTLLTPCIFYFYTKHLLSWFVIGLLIVSGFGTIYLFPYSIYKAEMWVGWSLIFILGLFLHKIRTKWVIFLGIISGGFFVWLFFLWNNLHRSINFTDNKYPPNFYYLSFALCMTLIFFVLAQRIVQYIPQWVYGYISKKSYSLFFIHFIILDILISFQKVWNLSIAVEIILVVGLSIGVSFILDNLIFLVHRQRP